ncbi:uncharacterized protein LOC143305568 [Osmia lignaria lignaria]|uniref:uncharacterized protein LOC143305568 n=1 Tax=Osmia lignaria lignaria TaxID=1437193 RepID=UPI00402B6156
MEVPRLEGIAFLAIAKYYPIIMPAFQLTLTEEAALLLAMCRERQKRRRMYESRWAATCTEVDLFDLRYLFGEEIDPDWW